MSSPYWITSLGYSPLLRFSTLAPLVTEYFPEGVGVSPTTVNFSSKRETTDDMVTNDDGMTVCLSVCLPSCLSVCVYQCVCLCLHVYTDVYCNGPFCGRNEILC